MRTRPSDPASGDGTLRARDRPAALLDRVASLCAFFVYTSSHHRRRRRSCNSGVQPSRYICFANVELMVVFLIFTTTKTENGLELDGFYT